MKPIKLTLFAALTLGFVYVIFDSIQHIRAEIHHRNGFIKKERGYTKLANIDYKTAVNLIPWENHYRLQLAKSYEATATQHPNEYKKFINLAIKEYEKLITSDPLNPWFKARLGLIYHDLHKKYPKNNDFKRLAHDLAKGATNNDPKNPLFTLHYGHLLYTYNQLEKSKKYYKKTLTYDSSMTEAHFNIAAIYTEENNKEKAIPHYKAVAEQLVGLEKSYRKNPSAETKTKIERFQNARIALAEHYLETNNTPLAYSIINNIPVSVEKYELLATFYEKSNNKEAAISLYKQLNTRLKTDAYSKKIQQLTQ